MATTNGGAEPVAPAPHGGEQERAIIDAAGRLMARWGVTKTTVGDIAVEAGCSRATVYRAFPGGKQQIMTALGRDELNGYFAEAAACVDGEDDLEDALVLLMTAAARGLADHAGFQFMLAHEPGLVLPYLGFSRIDRLYHLVGDQLGPHFVRFVGDDAVRIVELSARIVLSYAFQPSPTVDLTDQLTTRSIVQRHVLPAFTAVSSTRLAVPA
jgi:AcrR family transcriptional regulator